MSLPYTYVIGLEVHVELSTLTKMFCRCLNEPFNSDPNINTCPVCFGLPGTLPVPNLEAVRKTILLGLALGSEIPRFCKFDRKHYFYPDLPKGYQISQYDLPLCVGGELKLQSADGLTEKIVHFERVHLEEDAGKLLHGGQAGYSLVDLNRAGVPLAEMVSKPDLTTPEEARRFLQELRLLVKSIGVSEADMEKGQLRCDVNVSIKFEHEAKQVWTPVTEIKNVNSTKAVERSLQVEGQRLYDEWLANGPIRTRLFKLTAGWNEDSETISINRTKEAANDYRYFPEPDIPPLAVYEIPELDPRLMSLPESPAARRLRYQEAGVPAGDIETLISNDRFQQKFEEHLKFATSDAKTYAAWVINMPAIYALPTEQVEELIGLTTAGALSFSAVRKQVVELSAELSGSSDIKASLSKLGLLQLHDDGVVQSAIREVIAGNPAAIEQYRSGETKVLGFLTGQVMQKAKGQAQPALVQSALIAALSS